jgi:hypothetical protein
MAILSGDIRKTNAVFLMVLAPIIVRIWYEAVVWRLDQGPQMLGFQVLHLAAGGEFAPVLAPLLLCSFLAVYVYLFWVIVVVVLRFIPRARRGLSNVHLAGAGALLYVVFGLVADFLQSKDLSRLVLVGAAVLLSAVVFVFGWLIYIGFKGKRAHIAV